MLGKKTRSKRYIKSKMFWCIEDGSTVSMEFMDSGAFEIMYSHKTSWVIRDQKNAGHIFFKQ